MLIEKKLLFDLVKENINMSLTDKNLDDFDLFAALLFEKNKKVNLTSIIDPTEIVYKHFLDSLLIFKDFRFEKNSKIIDLGTGGGFPGIPILIVQPDVRLVFVDSVKKKLSAVEEFLEALDLQGQIIHARAEDILKDKSQREIFDYSVSRAVSPLNVLSELTLPFLKLNGKMIAYKGSASDAETEKALNSIKLLGGVVEKTEKFNIDSIGKRALIFIKKTKMSPEKYPRKTNVIKAHPL